VSDWLTVHIGDCRAILDTLPERSVHCVVTSPPYWGLRDYGVADQLGLEATPEEYVLNLVDVFRKVRRVLRDDGTVWLNIGDSYAGSGKGAWSDDTTREANRHRVKETYVPTRAESPTAGIVPPGLKPKDLVGIPWRVAFALQADGWYLRSDVIWAKPNPKPESVTDRPTKSHEYVFLLSKSARYYFDQEAVRETATNGERFHGAYAAPTPTGPQRISSRNGRGDADNTTADRNIRTVWTIPTQSYPGAHFAVFPEALVEPCVKAGCPEGGTVLDPFAGSGTVGLVANRLSRRAILIDLNPEYLGQIERRNLQAPLGLVG
jgi:DNA modification methylase